MRNTSRAFRATATIAGVAALGASFAGTASADETTDFGNAFGDSSDSGFSGLENGLEGDGNSSDMVDNDLLTFDMPTSDGPFGDFGDFDSSSYEYDEDDDDETCRDYDDNEDADYGGNGFQQPVQCKGNDHGEGKGSIGGYEFDFEDFQNGFGESRD